MLRVRTATHVQSYDSHSSKRREKNKGTWRKGMDSLIKRMQIDCARLKFHLKIMVICAHIISFLLFIVLAVFFFSSSYFGSREIFKALPAAAAFAFILIIVFFPSAAVVVRYFFVCVNKMRLFVGNILMGCINVFRGLHSVFFFLRFGYASNCMYVLHCVTATISHCLYFGHSASFSTEYNRLDHHDFFLACFFAFFLKFSFAHLPTTLSSCSFQFVVFLVDLRAP